MVPQPLQSGVERNGLRPRENATQTLRHEGMVLSAVDEEKGRTCPIGEIGSPKRCVQRTAKALDCLE